MRKPFHSKKNQQNPNFILFFKYTKEREIERKRERERERERGEIVQKKKWSLGHSSDSKIATYTWFTPQTLLQTRNFFYRSTSKLTTKAKKRNKSEKDSKLDE